VNRGRRPALRRVLVIAGVIFLFLMLAGSTYQGVATALERRRFPHPGRLIDIGGQQLHLYCIGQGTPTVVLDAPAVTMSAVWARVQAPVSKVARVCSYDRAGLGWSEAGDAPFAPEAAVEQLHALLAKANERGPFVVAGAEFGAALARIFVSHYSDDTAALVLVNVPGATIGGGASWPSTQFLTFSPWLARIGLLRVTRTLSSRVRDFPEPAAGELRAFLNRPDHLTRAADELAQWNDVVALSEAAPLRRDLPVVQVEVEGTDRLGLLGSPRNANDAADGILRAVMRVRRRD
jgi:pimeloyl-ACP methyl ester carboxylesterase